MRRDRTWVSPHVAAQRIRDRVVWLAETNRHLPDAVLRKWLSDLADVSMVSADRVDAENRLAIWRKAIKEATA